jgi:predicted small metal-binding protein
VRVIRCDCGFEATADADETLIAEAQGHAREVHGMDVPGELILELAKPRSPGPKTKR